MMTDECGRGMSGDLFVSEGGYVSTVPDSGTESPAPCGAPVVKSKPERRAMTADEVLACRCIRGQVTFPVGHWDKKFMRGLPAEITEKQAVQVWRIFKTYRRQIVHADKVRLLALAEELAAPDLRARLGQVLKENEERGRCERGIAQ
jgi:hypothetical protein